MREEKIRVKIMDDGSVKLDVEGIKGEKCLDLTADLEEELGVVTRREKKRSFRERPARVATQNVSHIHRK